MEAIPFAQATSRIVPMPRHQFNPWLQFDSSIISHQMSEITRRECEKHIKPASL